MKYPGIYMEEINSNTKSIQALSTSVTAFIGTASKGPTGKPVYVTRYREFEQQFGGQVPHSWLAQSVRLFFLNGGSQLYCVRIDPGSDTKPSNDKIKEAFSCLDSLDTISLIATPGIGNPDILGFASEYCKNRGDCFYIGETGEHDQTPSDFKTFIQSIPEKTSYAAVYWPWLRVEEINGTNRTVQHLPPSGAIAGIYANTDSHQGVWKPPAGAEAHIKGISGLNINLTRTGLPANTISHINLLRTLPGIGTVIWGARTLNGDDDREFKYVSVRRTVTYISESIRRGTMWSVFEPNDENLWLKLRVSISEFLNQLFRSGAFQGSKQEEAFFIKCDRETHTTNDIRDGHLNILIGLALLKPAEFVIIRITHKVS